MHLWQENRSKAVCTALNKLLHSPAVKKKQQALTRSHGNCQPVSQHVDSRTTNSDILSSYIHMTVIKDCQSASPHHRLHTDSDRWGLWCCYAHAAVLTLALGYTSMPCMNCFMNAFLVSNRITNMYTGEHRVLCGHNNNVT